MWHVVILSGDQGYLTFTLNGLVSEGYEIRFITPNGVDRWTVFCFKAQG